MRGLWENYFIKTLALMSGQKRLDKHTRNIRVVAMPSKVRENEDGTKTQLYKVRPMRWPKKGTGQAQSRMAQ